MSSVRTRLRVALLFPALFAAALSFTPSGLALSSAQQGQSGASSAANRRIGAIKAINGTQITLTPDFGPDLNVLLQPTTRILRIAPGEKDLTNAAPILLTDLHVGDRILVGGKPSDDNQSLLASTVVAMSRSDLEARHQQDLQDWQKRGVDGLVKTVDAAARTVTISSHGKEISVHASSNTVIRRYAPDSVKFEDASLSTLQQVLPGDQLRARGERGAGGAELAADEIVSGSFPSFAGIVNSVDADSSSLTVRDLSTRKTVTVKITLDSQLRHLPPEMAQHIAMFLKAGAAGSAPGSASSANSVVSRPADAPGGIGATAVGGRTGGPPDIQRVLGRAPAVSLADLHKGDAVVILATGGKAPGLGTAIKLYSGVEPILQSASNAAQAMMIAPWNLGGPSADAGGP